MEYSRALSHLDNRKLIIFCMELSLRNTYPIIGTSDTKSNPPSKSSGGEGGMQTHSDHDGDRHRGLRKHRAGVTVRGVGEQRRPVAREIQHKTTHTVNFKE